MEAVTNSKKLVSPKEGKKMNVMGHEAMIKLHSADANNNYVFEVISPAGHGIPPHVHRDEDEVIYIMSGEFEIIFGDEVFIATAGSYLNFIRLVPHGFRNIGSTPGKTLWHVSPGEKFEEFFDKLGALPSGPPDLQKVAQLFVDYGMTILPPKP
jgi:quercetin dioxygenase-like cupin family protein